MAVTELKFDLIRESRCSLRFWDTDEEITNDARNPHDRSHRESSAPSLQLDLFSGPGVDACDCQINLITSENSSITFNLTIRAKCGRKQRCVAGSGQAFEARLRKPRVYFSLQTEQKRLGARLYLDGPPNFGEPSTRTPSKEAYRHLRCLDLFNRTFEAQCSDRTRGVPTAEQRG